MIDKMRAGLGQAWAWGRQRPIQAQWSIVVVLIWAQFTVFVFQRALRVPIRDEIWAFVPHLTRIRAGEFNILEVFALRDMLTLTSNLSFYFSVRFFAWDNTPQILLMLLLFALVYLGLLVLLIRQFPADQALFLGGITALLVFSLNQQTNLMWVYCGILWTSANVFVVGAMWGLYRWPPSAMAMFGLAILAVLGAYNHANGVPMLVLVPVAMALVGYRNWRHWVMVWSPVILVAVAIYLIRPTVGAGWGGALAGGAVVVAGTLLSLRYVRPLPPAIQRHPWRALGVAFGALGVLLLVAYALTPAAYHDLRAFAVTNLLRMGHSVLGGVASVVLVNPAAAGTPLRLAVGAVGLGVWGINVVWALRKLPAPLAVPWVYLGLHALLAILMLAGVRGDVPGPALASRYLTNHNLFWLSLAVLAVVTLGHAPRWGRVMNAVALAVIVGSQAAMLILTRQPPGTDIASHTLPRDLTSQCYVSYFVNGDLGCVSAINFSLGDQDHELYVAMLETLYDERLAWFAHYDGIVPFAPELAGFQPGDKVIISGRTPLQHTVPPTYRRLTDLVPVYPGVLVARPTDPARLVWVPVPDAHVYRVLTDPTGAHPRLLGDQPSLAAFLADVERVWLLRAADPADDAAITAWLADGYTAAPVPGGAWYDTIYTDITLYTREGP